MELQTIREATHDITPEETAQVTVGDHYFILQSYSFTSCSIEGA